MAVAGFVLGGVILTPLVSLAVSYLYVGGLFADQNGNVGIGTTTPSEALEVIGNVKVSGSISASNVGATPGVTYIAEDFEAYPIGESINGLGSVAGWNGAWADLVDLINGFVANDDYIITTTNPIEGKKSVQAQASTSAHVFARPVTSVNTSGDIVSIKMMSSGSYLGRVVVYLQGITGFYGWALNLRSETNEVEFYTGGSWYAAGTFTADVPVTVDVQFDFDNNRARARVDGGAWGSWLTSSNSTPYITNVLLSVQSDSSTEVTGTFDDIKFSHENL